MAAPQPGIMMDIGPIFGAFGLGVMFNLILYGILIMQCYVYFTNFKSDGLWLKLFVLFLLIADSLDTGLSMAILYDYVITHFGDLEHLGVATLISTMTPVLTAIIGCSVQLFFTHRVRIFSGVIWIPVIIGTLSVIAMGCNLVAVIIMNRPDFHLYVDFNKPVLKSLIVIWLITSLVADIMISASLVWHLHRKRTGFAVTDTLISRIVRMTVQTGLLTTTFALLDVIVFLALPTDLHLLFNYQLSKLFSNSLLSSLNARGAWEKSVNSSGRNTSRQEPRFSVHDPSRSTRSNVLFVKQTNSMPVGDAESHELSENKKVSSMGKPIVINTHTQFDYA